MIALLLAALAQQPVAPPSWRQDATAADRERLRGWREGWHRALAAARRGDGAGAIAADPALFDPDGALDRPMPPTGRYRCRTIRFLGPRMSIGDTAPCRIGAEDGTLRLTGVTAAHRFAGAVYPDTSHRAIFLGTLAFADERGPGRYGRVAGRDMIGAVERIGERRWRLVLPAPHVESPFDVVALEPDD